MTERNGFWAEKNVFKLRAALQKLFYLLALILLQEVFFFTSGEFVAYSNHLTFSGLGVVAVSSPRALLPLHNILQFSSPYLSAADIHVGNNQIYEPGYQYLPSCLVMGHRFWRRSDAVRAFTWLPHSPPQKAHSAGHSHWSKQKTSLWHHSSFASSFSTNSTLENFLFDFKNKLMITRMEM